ncbi:MAG: hypothetical protein MJA27_21180 [Pseudanabaenales cyanobacterium]|nr:hypothetical protein [Pseudanabaenales cyanobacterium]
MPLPQLETLGEALLDFLRSQT